MCQVGHLLELCFINTPSSFLGETDMIFLNEEYLKDTPSCLRYKILFPSFFFKL